MAAPHVTGAAHLRTGCRARAIRNLLLAGGDPIPALTVTVSRRLNAHGALTCAGTTVEKRLRPVRRGPSSSAQAVIRVAHRLREPGESST
jgi:hypothetical protein